LDRYVMPYLLDAAGAVKEEEKEWRNDPKTMEERNRVNSELRGMVGPALSGDLKRGSLKTDYFPGMSWNGAYYGNSNTVAAGPNTESSDLVHELSHAMWHRKMSKKDKEKFADSLLVDLRSRNRKGESIKDISSALTTYERSIGKMDTYDGTGKERATEWHAVIGSILPGRSSRKVEVPATPLRPRTSMSKPSTFEVATDTSVYEKYPALRESYKGMLSSNFIRESLKKLRPNREVLSANKP